MWKPIISSVAVCSISLLSTAAPLQDSKPPSASVVTARLPGTPAGQQFDAWLKAFNHQDLAVYRDFITAHSPELVKYVKDDHGFAVATGGFAIVRVDPGDDYTLSGLLTEPYSDVLTHFVIKVEPKPPYNILTLDLDGAPRPADMPLPTLSESDLVKALKHRLDVQSNDERFSGVVLLARGDRVLFERAYGFANLNTQQHNRTDTRFRIASMGKMFTAVGIMQLVEAGKLDLQSPLGTYLADYPNATIAQHVTLDHLLTHTGGTGDIFVPEIEAKRDQMHSLSDYVAVLGTRDPEFAPGSKWSYSNYGYVLLGRVLERGSGEEYFAYVRKHVFAPAGMRHSGTPTISKKPGAEAVGYMRTSDGPHWVAAPSGMPSVPTSAGGDLSTAHDLHAFARALQTGKLLKAASVEILTRGRVDAHNGTYAYGFKDQSRNGLRYIGHGGSAPGNNCELDFYPDSGYILIVLTNQDPPYGNRIADFVGNRLAVAAKTRR